MKYKKLDMPSIYNVQVVPHLTDPNERQIKTPVLHHNTGFTRGRLEGVSSYKQCMRDKADASLQLTMSLSPKSSPHRMTQ